ncbi:cilia- and flagella-associated protein 74 isoform X5 [Girardinichthys multiradiatus]|uniref:cilia- and flagella-associated protein 74 isoform X5 n=1 Tax=Girardinichthys multiradiatus TaxID=208333 RepID=UPI001FAB6518|nr:cilia- and flagella-associated protein 74 isoform X5 [Girardinichthys multiradiatus]
MDFEDRDSSPKRRSVRCGLLDVLFRSGDDPEDCGLGQEAFMDEEADLPSDLEWLQELSEESDSDGDLALETDNSTKRSYAETARMFKLRRNLDQLDSFHRQKERDVQKAREKLKPCRQNVESWLEQRDNLEWEIEQQKANANSSLAVFRLRAQHKLLCQKLQNEEELEGQIRAELTQQERELNEVEVDLGRVFLLRQELQEEEQRFQVLKAQKAVRRLQQERKVSQNQQHNMKLLRDKQAARLEEEEKECQRKNEEARTSQKKAAKYLKQTIKRLHQQAAEKEKQNREFIERRMQAVESLKSSIAVNQESLQVQQNRAKEQTQKKKEQERQLKAALEAQGIDSIKHMYQKKQLKETKRKQQEFEESQKSKRVEIVAKIHQEEQLLKSRKRNQAQPPKPSTNDKFSSLRTGREMLLSFLDPNSPSVSEETGTLLVREFSNISRSSSPCSDSEHLEEMGETVQKYMTHKSPADSLAEPEFSGLWEQEYKATNKDMTPAKAEVKKDEPAMANRKLNVTAKKIHGKAFISKPDVIFFKDFEVGKCYKKKLVLTNISYTVNQCKFLRVSAQLKDFISVNFEPPGSLSTGMSCDMHAFFQPLINEDLEGDFQFASTLGPFSVPVRCTTKKCCPEVDCRFVDFGSHVVGHTVSRTITLNNKGALATFFSMDTSTHLCSESSHVQMPSQASANTGPVTSSINISSSDHQSSDSLDSEAVRPKQQNLSKELQQLEPGVEAVTEALLSSDVDTQTTQTFLDSCDITLGGVRDGEVGPFQNVKLEILFTPTIPGETKLDFYIRFSDTNTKPIPIQVRGVAVSIPVWVVQPSIDLKICMFDRLYQDTIIIQSRANKALKVTFEVCPGMRKHMEILPKNGFIQAQSSFNAQLKFIPRRSLSKDAENYFDSDTGVLEVPMTVQVAGQVRPVPFTVQAIVTSSDLQFDQTEVDFGSCSVYHLVRSSVRLTNMSLLPQDFGFVAVPEFIEVQPNDGFGTLLPQETLEIDLIFGPKKAKEYNFQLCCKSGINRDFLLSCHGVGVRPPLSKEPTTQLTKDVMKVDGPRLFCFCLPKDSEISISPSAGRLLPGERCLVQVMFRPRLLDHEIKEEALRQIHCAKLISEKEQEINRPTEQEMKNNIPPEPNKGKRPLGNAKNSKVSENPNTNKLPDPVDIKPGSELYGKARAFLLKSFTRSYREYTVPCFVSDGDPTETDSQVQLAWSPTNTLYLKLECPAVQPPLLVTSSNGNNILDFNQVFVGNKVIKRFTVQNISMEPLDLRLSLLDIHGPFSLVNAMRGVGPGEKHTLVLAFSPTLERKYCEKLEVQTPKMVLEITLQGEGVLPVVTLSPTGDLVDFGYVLEKEITSQHVQLQNSSVVAVDYRVLLASQSLPSPQHGADRVALLLDGYRGSQIHPAVGTQNYSGLSVFSVTPVEGSIDPGQKQNITITFQPDHPSVCYSDKLTIELINKSKVCVMDLRGVASSHNMYLYGGDPLTVPIESLLPSLIIPHPKLTEAEENRSVHALVTLQASCKAGVIRPAVRELQVGCIRSPHTSKKCGEFYWDDVATLQQQGFQLEPVKGTVEAGHRRSVTITWTPQSGHKPFEVIQVCAPLTVKSDEIIIYRVTLMAVVSSTAD